MPILNYHLVRGQHDQGRIEELLVGSSKFFAQVLGCPIERVRVFVTEHSPRHYCIGGTLAGEAAQAAPYFSFIVLQGRPLEDRQRLLAGFTDLVVDILGVERSLVRGGVVPVDPDDWSIGGVPASRLRQAEIEARRVAAAKP